MTTRKTIKVDYLARVEGEGAMYLELDGDQVVDVKLKIFEPPRFFEALLRGRDFSEAPDITARICGICPVAYQMSAVHAMEQIAGVTVGGTLRELRRLLYCGEWIESHVLHMFMLHAPDFLGYAGAVEMAKDHGDLVKKALRLKKVGNRILQVLGGREIHPINVRVGGFYRAPTSEELNELVPELKWARSATEDAIRWAATLDFPHMERDYEFVSLQHPDEYPFNEGRIVSSAGLDIDKDEYGDHFEEIHVAHSNALQSIIKERGAYFVGPMARFALNFERLPEHLRGLAGEIGISAPCRNPFKSILVRGVEVLFAIEEALRIIDAYAPPASPHIEVPARAGVGHGATEAPRGILYHRYEIDEEGLILDAHIVPPTSQNQKTIEEDLHVYVANNVMADDETLRHTCEMAIRNYDPCISCATHFLDLTVKRDGQSVSDDQSP